MSKVSFSVIIPAFEASATLPQTLDSLLAQRHASWEAIVVDDGSGDATAEVARTYAERDERIRLLQQDRAGEGGARNAGIEAARCDWLVFLDSDDWLTPEALESFNEAILHEAEADVICGMWSRVGPDGTLTPETSRPCPD